MNVSAAIAVLSVPLGTASAMRQQKRRAVQRIARALSYQSDCPASAASSSRYLASFVFQAIDSYTSCSTIAPELI